MHQQSEVPHQPTVVSVTTAETNPPTGPTTSVHAVGVPHSYSNEVLQAATGADLGLKQYVTVSRLLETASPTAVGCVLLFADGSFTTTVQQVEQLRINFGLLPVVVMMADPSNDTTVDLMQRGAFSIVGHDVSYERLVETLLSATDISYRSQFTVDEGRESSKRLGQATHKEREVLSLILQGRRNKEISAALGITVRAVEDRRFRLMRKMEVESVAELVATAVKADFFEQGFSAANNRDQVSTSGHCLLGIEIWKPSADKSCLCLDQSTYQGPTAFGEASHHMTFRPGEGLPGRIWQSKAPVFLRELISTEFVRTEIAGAAGMTTAIGFPIFSRGEVQSIILLLLDMRHQATAAFESWKFDKAIRQLRLTGGTYVNCERLRRLTEFMAFPLGEDLPGRAAEQRTPCISARFADDATSVRGVALAAERFITGLAIPLSDSGAEYDNVLLMFNSEATPLFSLQQIWKTTASGTRLELTAELIDGVSTLSSEMQDTSEIQPSGIVGEAWKSASPVICDLNSAIPIPIASGQSSRQLSTGIAVPLQEKGQLTAVVVLAN